MGLQVGDGTVEGRKGRHAASRESLLEDGEGEAGLEGDGVLQEKLGVGVLNSSGSFGGKGPDPEGCCCCGHAELGSMSDAPIRAR